MGIKKANLIVDEIIDIVSLWDKYGIDAGVSKFHREQIGKNLRLL